MSINRREVRIDINTQEAKAFSGSLYSVSPDGKYIISPNLMTMNAHQYGYAVPDLPPAPGKPRTELDRKIGGSPHKLDPHPAWNRDYTQMCLNGAPDGRRQVFIADLTELVGKNP